MLLNRLPQRSAVDPDVKSDKGNSSSNTGGKDAAPAATGGRSAQQQAGAGGVGGAGGEPSTDPGDGAAGHDSQTDAGVDAGGGGEPAPEQGGTGGTEDPPAAGSGGHAGGTGGAGGEDLFNVGVATQGAPLDQVAGQTSTGFGIDTSGVIDEPKVEGQPFERSAPGEYGFVVDYRTDRPTVYLIAGSSDQARVAGSRALSAISEPLYIHLSGLRRKQGFQATINPGNDTTNQPFVLNVRGALQANGHADVAQALVLGWVARTPAHGTSRPSSAYRARHPAKSTSVNR